MKYADKNVDLLRKKMEEDGLKAYLIVTGDPHGSEEPCAHFAAERRYFCPFDGDNAYVLVTEDEALLFTDGRFFVSAEQEIKGTYFSLMKLYTPGYPSPEEYIRKNSLYPLGTNFLLISPEEEKELAKGGKVLDVDYSRLLPDLPAMADSMLWRFDGPSYNDLSSKEKITRVLEQVASEGAEAHLLSTLDDIAYLLNIRGNDIPYTPVFYSYLYLSLDEGAHLFVSSGRIDFPLDGIVLHPYEDVFSFLKQRNQKRILVDPQQTNAKIFSLLRNPVVGRSPSRLMKAIKGETEIENIKKAQAEDGVALLKFIAFLDEHKNDGLTEWECAEKLGEFRKEGKHYIEDSFQTIAAAGPNAAMMHYAPTKSRSSCLGNGPELLVDSGGQYFCGTTDTTRTFLIGEPTAEFVRDYTLTLKAVIALSNCVFLEGSTGKPIDMMAREVMWRYGMDYKCGTGHGIGYVNVVHESPNGFRYRAAKGKDDGAEIVPGMVTSIEPGVYKAGKYGIRIENDILAVKAFSTEDGQFYRFENLTYVPIETKALDLSLLTDEEIRYLNAYHELVYEVLSPLVSGSLLDVLKEKTKPVHR